MVQPATFTLTTIYLKGAVGPPVTLSKSDPASLGSPGIHRMEARQNPPPSKWCSRRSLKHLVYNLQPPRIGRRCMFLLAMPVPLRKVFLDRLRLIFRRLAMLPPRGSIPSKWLLHRYLSSCYLCGLTQSVQDPQGVSFSAITPQGLPPGTIPLEGDFPREQGLRPPPALTPALEPQPSRVPPFPLGALDHKPCPKISQDSAPHAVAPRTANS